MATATDPFDHYIPLGVNCEVNAQLCRRLGGRESGFFANGVTMLEPLVSLLSSDFAGICQPENLVYEGVGTLILDTSHHFAFHWAGPEIHKIAEPTSVEFVRNVGRLHYLAAKFRKIVSSGGRIAFIYLCHDEQPFEPLCRAAEILEHRFGVKDFKLLVLQRKERFEPEWDHPRLVNRYLEKLAPWGDVTAGSNECWDKLFAEFPLRG